MSITFKPILDLYNAIATQAPGFNEDSALDELRRAAREFAQETACIRDTLETDAAKGDALLTYESASTSQAIATSVAWVTTPNGPLQPTTLEEMNSHGAWRTTSGYPTRFMLEAPGEVLLWPIPSEAVTPIYVRMIYMPTFTATKLPSALVDQYAEAVIDGALHRILRMPNQTWTNPGAAQEARTRFTIEMSRVKAAWNRDNGPAHITTRLPAWR